MPIPVWTVGEVLASADVNSWFVPLSAVATTDQSITNNSVAVTDNALALPVAAGCIYRVDLFIRCNGPAANNFDCEFSGPSGSGLSGTATNAGSGDINFGAVWEGVATTGTGNDLTFVFTGTAIIGSTAGTFQFLFGQGSSSATATTRRARSRLALQRLA